jgi:uncharacterized RDD family membrane protein YckC
VSLVQVVPAEARGFQRRPAGLVSRLLANAIDLTVAIVITVAIYAGWAGFKFLRRGADFTFPTVSLFVAITVLLIVLAAFFTVAWTTSGRTYGDRVLGLRVQLRDGRPIGLVRSLLRAVLCVHFPLLILWAAISRDRRSVQDLLVGTSVVYDWGPPGRATSDDPVGMAVDVAAPVADEPRERQPEPVGGVDGQR